jgi:hypothetical protein
MAPNENLKPPATGLAQTIDRSRRSAMNVESHAGESITGDLMTKAW